MTLSPNCPAMYLGVLGDAYRQAGTARGGDRRLQGLSCPQRRLRAYRLVMAYQENGQPEEARETAARLMAARPEFTIAAWRKSQAMRRDKARSRRPTPRRPRASGLPMNCCAAKLGYLGPPKPKTSRSPSMVLCRKGQRVFPGFNHAFHRQHADRGEIGEKASRRGSTAARFPSTPWLWESVRHAGKDEVLQRRMRQTAPRQTNRTRLGPARGRRPAEILEMEANVVTDPLGECAQRLRAVRDVYRRLCEIDGVRVQNCEISSNSSASFDGSSRERRLGHRLPATASRVIDATPLRSSTARAASRISLRDRSRPFSSRHPGRDFGFRSAAERAQAWALRNQARYLPIGIFFCPSIDNATMIE